MRRHERPLSSFDFDDIINADCLFVIDREQDLCERPAREALAPSIEVLRQEMGRKSRSYCVGQWRSA